MDTGAAKRRALERAAAGRRDRRGSTGVGRLERGYQAGSLVRLVVQWEGLSLPEPLFGGAIAEVPAINVTPCHCAFNDDFQGVFDYNKRYTSRESFGVF